MKHPFFWILLVIAIAIIATIIYNVFINVPQPLFVEGEITIKLKEGAFFEGTTSNIGSLNELNNRFKVYSVEKVFEPKIADETGLDRIYSLRFQARESASSVAGEYSKNEWVEYAEPNYIGHPDAVPNDPSYAVSQWNLYRLVGVNAEPAWNITRGDSNVQIAVLDTGAGMSVAQHAELVNKIVVNKVISNDTSAFDCLEHGTFVHGIAGADTNNGIGVASLGWNITLMNVKVYNSGCSTSNTLFANGIIWATDNGAEVITISTTFGWPCGSTLSSAINYSWNNGVLLVAGAGNAPGTVKQCPAAEENVIAVTSTNTTGGLYSGHKSGNWVDVAAPGVSLYGLTRSGGYTGGGIGTSFATPHVSALAALLYGITNDSNGNGRVNDEVRDIIRYSSNNTSIASSPFVGIAYGRINAYNATLLASGGVTPVTPDILLVSPGNNSVLATDPVNFIYVVTSPYSISSCSLIVNGSIAQTDSTVIKSVNQSFAESLVQGVYAWSVNCTDSHGTQGGSETRILTVNAIDTTPPATSITSPAASSWFKSDFTVQYDATDANIDTCSISTKDGAGMWIERSVACGAGQSLLITVNSGGYCITEGANACGVNVTARDASGNTNGTTRSFSTDRTPPTIDSIQHTPTTGITSDTDVTIEIDASDGLSGLNEINIFVDNQLKKTCASSPCIQTASYPAGTHAYNATSSDNAGNELVSSQFSFDVSEAESDETSPLSKGTHTVRICISRTCQSGILIIR